MRETQRVRFSGPQGHTLVGILERPREGMRFQAVFCHCFTCTKDLKAIVRISRELVRLGIGVFRFDFTGLGESSGDFSTSTFADNCLDLQAAIEQVTSLAGETPRLLIGHSLGGATCLATAAEHPEIKAVCSLAAPSDTPHLIDKLYRMNPELETRGEGEVTIGGTTFLVRQPMIDGLREFELEARVRKIEKPVLLIHSPADETLGIEHAFRLHEWLQPWGSLHVLANSDHLFSQRAEDANFLARLISNWSEREGVSAAAE